jgi:hypothetical protein
LSTKSTILYRWFFRADYLAFKRAKVVKAITGRIPVRFVGCGHAGCNHLPGHIFVIRPFFFLFFTFQTYRLMVIDGQQPAVLSVKGLSAAPAAVGTGKLFFPIFFHFSPRDFCRRIEVNTVITDDQQPETIIAGKNFVVACLDYANRVYIQVLRLF